VWIRPFCVLVFFYYFSLSAYVLYTTAYTVGSWVLCRFILNYGVSRPTLGIPSPQSFRLLTCPLLLLLLFFFALLLCSSSLLSSSLYNFDLISSHLISSDLTISSHLTHHSNTEGYLNRTGPYDNHNTTIGYTPPSLFPSPSG
jgi:hypothetical protein